jgi:dephospho-CoA kinase
MLIIGLTGGIASGKTTVSKLFSSLGVPIIDTDIISRRLLERDQPAYEKIVEHFGDEILHEDQNIDRHRLRRIVFDKETERLWLEDTLHPIINQQTRQQIKQYKDEAYVIVVIPLLFETDFQTLVNRILVIDCATEIQIKRLIARDSIELNLAQKMLAQQWSNKDRLKRADDIIHNDYELDGDVGLDLDRQVAKLHQKYLLLSA